MAEAAEFLPPVEALEAQQEHCAHRKKLVRNRWQLYWVLHKNPVRTKCADGWDGCLGLSVCLAPCRRSCEATARTRWR
jgi:hypothetical protein